MRKLNIIALLICIPLLVTGCYHAQITTGEDPSTDVYQESWAVGWLGGLIGPDIVQAQNHCTHGVARVETQLSFANQFVTFLTGGIFSPMTITVTCAAASAQANPDEDAVIEMDKTGSDEYVQEVFQEAANTAQKLNKPVYVDFR